ncbi:MAG: leucine--tRNA ligase [Candidatus Latescibacteria bacterium]|jgi:leucyl-tRNA synthetase|nr:leucine--tRNA ligase [Candidatus Latescibacterota bacterium]
MSGKSEVKYDHREIEKKWRERWSKRGDYKIDMDKAQRPFYNLMMFPYPSAEGLHVGNVYAFTGSDIYGRFMKMCGYDVFEPIGFDAFGMHSENFAISKGVHPAQLVPENISNFRDNQLKLIGNMFDWSRQVDTTDKNYYKWTQWIFVQLFKNNLAYQEEASVNWCPSCKTVLASEQVISEKCERCSSTVTRKKMLQWFFRITKYAERLNANLDTIDWSDITVSAQRNWIGKSQGADIDFAVSGCDEKLRVFTTRPDTIFGATYMVLAPEHPLVEKITPPEQKNTVESYVREAVSKSEQERIEEAGEKTGVFTGGYAVNPANGKQIPIWVADYVLIGYGTGAIMAVPAHDERDFEFATEFNLPIVEVISPDGTSHTLKEAYSGEGIMINSGEFNGITSQEAIGKITGWFAERGKGKKSVNYRLRDWCISRQRYWGPPIPVIHCKSCGPQAVPESDLPVLLPEMDDFRPDGSGRSPLSRNEDFVNTTCPQCGGPARRETDVMDNFLDSAWYFFRYPSTEFDDMPFDRERTKKWLPVDMYIGGNEHAVLHLLYTRFITMALKDMGYIEFDEPFKCFRAHGLIIKDGTKMSKSRGNVVTPDTFIAKYGADCFRTYLMFLGPYTLGGDFQDKGITGVRRFYDRIYRLACTGNLSTISLEDKKLITLLHKTVRDVTKHIQNLEYNTAIAFMMEFLNEINRQDIVYKEAVEILVRLIEPFAPHLSEELWEMLGYKESIFTAGWPEWDESKIVFDTFELVAQVNGKIRAAMEAPMDISSEDAIALATSHTNVQRFIEGKPIRKTIYVPGKLVNIVV